MGLPSSIKSNPPRFLYHKSPISVRKSIMKQGLIPQIGDSYKCHYEGSGSKLKPYVFMYDHNTIADGEYDSTYDDDIFSINTEMLDWNHVYPDPDTYMKGCFVYDLPIPPEALKLIYKGSTKDSDNLSSHFNIYESEDPGVISITDDDDDYGGIFVNAQVDGKDAGYATVVIHRDIESLDSEISDTDSPEMASDVIRRLDYNKPVVEIADMSVKKGFRNMGLSKIILQHILDSYNTCQFYVRVSPTDGVDEQTLVKSLEKYGFIDVDNSENGTFMVKVEN